MDIRNLCFELTDISSTSGAEKNITEKISEFLKNKCSCKIDNLGNIIATVGEGDFHILLDAHIDQVGMIVKEIDDKGFIRFEKIGGLDLRILTGNEVVVYGKEALLGVISSVPPHLQKTETNEVTIDTLAIDIGMNSEKAQKYIKPGDRITLRNNPSVLLNDCISASALDNKSGIVVLLNVFEKIKDKLSKIKLTFLFSTMEEVGCRGVGAAIFEHIPDLAVVVDVGYGNDAYTSVNKTITLGGGPSVGFSPLLDFELSKEFVNVATINKIPHQVDVMGSKTGTNADIISNTLSGVKTALISVPLRFMHTGNEVVSIKDIENASELIAEFLIQKDGECIA